MVDTQRKNTQKKLLYMLQITQEIVQSEWVCLWNKKKLQNKGKKTHGQVTHTQRAATQPATAQSNNKERKKRKIQPRTPSVEMCNSWFEPQISV